MIDHLLWSTATALIALGAAWLLRHRSASIRFNILFIALLRFAIPTPWLTEAGSMLALRMPTPVTVVVRKAAIAVAELSMPAPTTKAVSSAPGERLAFPTGSSSAPEVPVSIPAIPMLWGLGTLAVVVQQARRRRLRLDSTREPNAPELAAFDRASKRMAEPSAHLRIVASNLTPCVQGLFHSTVLLPEGLSKHLTESELESVLSHELAHVRRYDNLSALAAQLITAAFWFHPFAILLRYKLLTEREIACDELVLIYGTEREHYLSGIAKVCRQAVTPAPGYANIGGSNLKQRLQHIEGHTPGTVKLSSRMMPSILAVFALLLPAATSFLRAQSPGSTSKSSGSRPRSIRGFSDSQAGKLLTRLEALVKEGRRDDAEALLLAEGPRVERESRDGERTILRVSLMDVYTKTNHLDEALLITNSLLAELPSDGPENRILFGANSRPSLYFQLAEIYRRKGDWHKVKSYLELSVHAHGGPESEVDSYMRSFLQELERGQEQRYIDRVAPIDPNLAVALNTNTLFPDQTDHVRLKH